MKTLMGARLNDMRAYESEGYSFAQAAFRWALSSPRVDAVLVSMTSTARIDEYVAASGTAAIRQGDLELLERYAALQGASYCRHGCNACESACPEGVDIAEVLRARMYAVDYRDQALAARGLRQARPGRRRLPNLRAPGLPRRLRLRSADPDADPRCRDPARLMRTFLAHYLILLAAWTVTIKFVFPVAFAVAEGAPLVTYIYWDFWWVVHLWLAWALLRRPPYTTALALGVAVVEIAIIVTKFVLFLAAPEWTIWTTNWPPAPARAS